MSRAAKVQALDLTVAGAVAAVRVRLVQSL